jgi:hypothetical protein
MRIKLVVKKLSLRQTIIKYISYFKKYLDEFLKKYFIFINQLLIKLKVFNLNI